MLNDSVSGGEPGSGGGSGGEEAEGGVAFGIFLRQERLRRDLTLADMARAVRAPENSLEALEDGEYGSLPPKPYVRGFLDAYARRLSLDPDEIWQRFEESFRASSRSDIEEGRSIFGLFRPQGDKFHWRDWAVPIALAFAVVVFLSARWFLEEKSAIPRLEPAPPVESAGDESVLPLHQGAEIDRFDLPVTASDAGAAGVRLFVRAAGSTWMSVTRDGGEPEEWTMDEGETREVTARKQLVLSLGNAGAVQLTVNGRELGFIGQMGEVKRNVFFTAPGDE
jgi:cytoskeletal protein RodZ